MNQEFICNIGRYLVSHSDFKYNPCDSSAVIFHLFAILAGIVIIPLTVKYFRSQHPEGTTMTEGDPDILNVVTPRISKGMLRAMLSIIACGVILGYGGIAPERLGVYELIGITLLVCSISLPSIFDVNWLNYLRTAMMVGGFLLVMITTDMASSHGFNSFLGFITAFSFWTVTNLARTDFLSSFDEPKSGILLATTALVSLGIGYLGSFYFTF